MNILVLFSHIWRGGRAGGAETHAIQLMKELSLRGHQIVFVAANGKADIQEIPAGVVAQYRLPFQSLNPFDKARAYRQLAEIVAKHRIDVIHAHHRTGGYFAECIYRRTGVPYVITVHDIWHRAPLKQFHGKIFRRLIAVSGFIKKGLEKKFGIPGERIRVIHNGVDPARIEKPQPEEAAQFREKFGIKDEIVFSLVARVSRAKGHFDLVEAVRLLPPRLNCKFLIVGEGKEKPELQQLVKRYGLSQKIVFCGFQSNIPAVMQASDVIMLPSHREPFAVTILEAMFSRKPLLVSNSGGTPEAITNDRDGIVFPLKNISAFANAIELLASDEALRLRLGDEAYRTAHCKFLLSQMIDDTEAYYFEIVKAARDNAALSVPIL